MNTAPALRLADQAILVTGAARGIGRAIALRLAREGARVGINYRTQAAAAEQLALQIRELGGEAQLFPGDVADAGAAHAVVAAAQQAWGRLDALVNNA
ncbi:MAG: SDR family NAD(P)-dependent oxidoreductase, partial [Terriglobales bacterium]